MARKLKSDKLLFGATLLLICTGIVMVYSASAVLAMEKHNDPYFFLMKQSAWVLIGLCLLPIVMRFDYRHYREPAVIWTLLAVAVGALIVVLFGRPVNGATRWLSIGGLGIQPSELAKLAIIIFTADLLARRMSRIDDVSYTLLPIAVVLAIIVALILLQPDLGTAAALTMIAAAMVFAAGLSYSYLAGLFLASLPAVYLLIVSYDYRWKRITAFLDPESDPLGAGHQVLQSKIAVGAGGIFGKGLMAGMQKFFYLPEPHNDFIYAVAAEELGLFGATLIVGCFVVIAWRGLRAGARAPDRFGAFLAIGLTTMITFQALFNISVVLGLLPTKGIPLPFVSAGGSSLLINMVGIGILLNVSQHACSSRVAAASPAVPDA